MSFATAEAAIKARLIAMWDEPTVPLFWQNETLVVPEPPFVEVKIVGLRETMAAFGGGPLNNELDVDGTIEMQIFVPLGSGTVRARFLRDKLAAIFRGSRFSGVTVYGVNPFGGGDMADQGNSYGLLAIADFIYRFKG
jgi:hypothetical protein